jgi:membrane-associated protease RseP (regulator of RpoE activity)
MSYPEYDINYQNIPDPGKTYTLFNRIKINRLYVHLILLVLTIFSTWLVYSIWYAVSIVIILFAHEMGHYLMCRRHKIRATLPFFIPFPFPMLNPFGTLGAVIKIEDRIPNRKALFDIGIAGPVAGLCFTIPALIIGLKLSTVVKVTEQSAGTLFLGDSLLFSQLSKLIIGKLPPNTDVALHPVAFAGWAGLFVTALNLMPLGQLDGGHVLYAIFGEKTATIFKIVLAIFIFICAIWYPGWLLFILLIIWFGYRHPPPIDDFTPINQGRRILGYIVFAIFLISFTPVPFYFTN